MGLGLRARLLRLKSQCDPSARYVDIALRLHVCERDRKRYKRTGHYREFGGVWDRWSQRYDRERVPSKWLDCECTAAQLAYVLSDRFRITGAGGRGGGKSEALVLRCIRLLIERPGEHGLVLTPDYPHGKIVWSKLLRRVLPWLMPGAAGINRVERVLRFINGSSVLFKSAHGPDIARGFEGSWLAIDEEKDVSNEAIDIAIPCCRLTDRPLIFGAGTPELGEYSERYEQMVANAELCEVFRFPSFDNCFISVDIFEKAVALMDERRYRQEVLAEFVRLEDAALVADGFDRKLHLVDLATFGRRDITPYYTRRKFGEAYKYVVGVDYNNDYPNYAAVYRIFEGGFWVLVDIVRAVGLASKLGQAIVDAGYKAHECVVVDDASGEFNNVRGRQSPNSAVRLMRSVGFNCVHPTKNPPVRDRANAFLQKLSPLKSEHSWGYVAKIRADVEKTMEGLVWSSSGKELDKSEGLDHLYDAATYPIHRCEPPALFKYGRGVHGALGA